VSETLSKGGNMLTDYYSSLLTLERFRCGILAPFIEGFIKRLEGQGYPPSSIRAYLSTAAHLGFWGASNDLEPRDLENTKIRAFLDHLPTCRCFRKNCGKYEAVPAHLRFLLGVLQELGIIAVEKVDKVKTEPRFIIDFKNWMIRNRGVSEATLKSYTPVLLELLDGTENNIQGLNAKTIRGFFLRWADHHAQSSTSIATAAVRMFLRYLIIDGKIPPSFICAVPSMANWRFSTLPRYLPAADIERLLEYWKPTTQLGARNRAILLLLARLGLRAGDVVGMQLNDIDWSQATIRVCGKGRRETLLPLTQEVGDALLAYLAYRPNKSEERHLFIRDRAPLRPLSAHGSISTMVARTMKRAGISSPFYGAHVLRHSAATQMLKEGASLQSIGSVLRHRTIETTEQYAKVDTKTLRLVAQPWPEVTYAQRSR
jgi:integrase/recombinase XerD